MSGDEKTGIEDKGANWKTPVFLAWSGPVSQKMACLLKQYLPLFVRNADVFMSRDIDEGGRWSTEIAGALSSARFGILCLTSENLSSEWMHFEAGALSQTIDDSTHICPFLLDLKKSDLREPLASFQAVSLQADEFRKLAKTLAQVCGDSLDEDQFEILMTALWPKIEEAVVKLKNELTETRRKGGAVAEVKSKADVLLDELISRSREQGRFLAGMAERIDSSRFAEVASRLAALQQMYARTSDAVQELLAHIPLDERRTDAGGGIRGERLAGMSVIARLIEQVPTEVRVTGAIGVIEYMKKRGLVPRTLYHQMGEQSGMLDAIHYCLKAVDKAGGTSDGETAK